MKISIREIIIEGTAPEIKGLFSSSQELTAEIVNTCSAATATATETKETDPKPEETEKVTAPAAEPADAPAAAPAEEEEAKPKAATPAEGKISNEDVREAMEKVRLKFEYGTPAPGEDKGPNEEMDETIHKALTKAFKQAAKACGSDKPSTLDEDKRADFINTIRNLSIVDGQFIPF